MSPNINKTEQVSYIRNLPEGKYFCINTIKMEVENFQSDEERLVYLLHAKTQYLQAGANILEIKNDVTFAEKIDFQIDFIKFRHSVSREFNDHKRVAPAHMIQPIKINCNVNQLGDIFYQLLNEATVNDKPLLETTISNLARMICNSFIDKDGNELSLESLKTILSKAHPEKRPKHIDRITFK